MRSKTCPHLSEFADLFEIDKYDFEHYVDHKACPRYRKKSEMKDICGMATDGGCLYIEKEGEKVVALEGLVTAKWWGPDDVGR